MDPSLPGVIDASGDSSAVQREVRFVWSSGLCRMARPELLGIILVGASAWLWLLPGCVGGEEGQLQTQLAATQCFSGRERGATQFDDGNPGTQLINVSKTIVFRTIGEETCFVGPAYDYVELTAAAPGTILY